MMVFVIPHNFLAPIVPKMENAFAKGAIGISLIKGIEFEDGKPILISDLLKAEMKKSPGAPGLSVWGYAFGVECLGLLALSEKGIVAD